MDARTRGEQSAAMARLLVARLRAEAEARGPVTDAELEEVTTRRWFDIDRPAGMWVVQVHVAVASTAAAGSTKRAEAVAARIRDELGKSAAQQVRDEAAKDGAAGIDPAQLATRAAGNLVIEAVKRVPSDGFEVEAQLFPAFASDGRTVEPGNRSKLKAHLVDVAQSLASPGDVSAPFAGDEGVDLLVLLGHTRASQFSAEERRSMVREEILALRTRAALTALLGDLAAQSPVEVDRQVDGLLGLVQVSPPASP